MGRARSNEVITHVLKGTVQSCLSLFIRICFGLLWLYVNLPRIKIYSLMPGVSNINMKHTTRLFTNSITFQSLLFSSLNKRVRI